MMSRLSSPVSLMVIGVVLMAFASVMTFFMALRWVYSSMWLNFLAIMASVVGSTIGLYGLFQKTRPPRN
ncbi:hypothetical protein ACFLSG_00110 [Candidatus Bipolaricaulota bacterium]